MSVQSFDFTKARVLVVGDVMLDRYLFGDTSRISPEAPIPIVKVSKIENRLGGAGNVAFNLASLGASATLLGLIGQDEASDTLEDLLLSSGLKYNLLNIENKPTIVKLRTLSQNQQLLRIDFEEEFDLYDSNKLLQIFAEELKNFDVVVLSDYGKGTLKCAQDFITLARAANIPVFIDPKNPDFSVYNGATLVKPNLKEFQNIVGSFSDENEIKEKAYKLMQYYNIEFLILTRGKDGMDLFGLNGDSIHIDAISKEVFDITGAGDTVISVLAASIASGIDLVNSVKIANYAAGIVVEKLGASTVNVKELEQAFYEIPLFGVVDEETLLSAIQKARSKGEKIVMTNGCFDILHAGHVNYLEQAKKLGDRLIVAVNDDASITRLKGQGRPINSLSQRLSVLSGLKAIDWVVPFYEDTPERLIKRVLPDVLVKGGDYTIDTIVGADCVLRNGGEVRTIDLVNGCSTTSTIKNIKDIF